MLGFQLVDAKTIGIFGEGLVLDGSGAVSHLLSEFIYCFDILFLVIGIHLEIALHD